MSVAIWILVIFMPIDGAGRQVGPFATKEQCEVVERAYNQAMSIRGGPQSKCFQAVHKTAI